MDKFKHLLKARELTSLLIVVIVFLLVGLVNPAFLQISNILLCLNGGVVFTIVAVGSAFVILTGEIDISVGATIGLTAAVTGSMIRDGRPWAAAILAAVLIGAFIGVINGFGVTVFRIPSIIMTLGINGIVRGMSYVYTNGKWVENVPFEFKSLSQAMLPGGMTYFYFSVIVLTVIIYFVLTKTKKGRYFAAVGDNVDGATLIGIPVEKIKMLAFVICGIFSAVAGTLYVSRVGFVTPTAGSGYEMKAIAACVLGGISLSGGKGSVIGAAIGAITMASISRILVFLQFSSDYDNTITGILLITIVVADVLLEKHRKEKARRIRLSVKTADYAAGGAVHE